MRKALMILVSAALGASMASGADVVVKSQNIAGFSQATVPSNAFWMVACNFQKTDGSNEISIQELFPAEELYMDPTNNAAKCDQIMVFNGSYYKIYTYNQIYSGGFSGSPVWKDGAKAATNKFKRGDGFWFKRAPESPKTTLTMVGQAPTNTPFAHISLPKGFFMMGYAYPKATPLTNLTINAYMDSANDAAKCDQIMVFDGTSYKTYVWNKLFDGENWTTGPFWKYGTTVTSDSLSVGQAAWYKRSADAPNAASWTETKPY